MNEKELDLGADLRTENWYRPNKTREELIAEAKAINEANRQAKEKE